MSSPSYCTESNVYDETGFDTSLIQQFSGKNADQVTTLINAYILEAERQINDWCNIPHVVHREFHKGTGENDEFTLGAEDELGFYEEYNPANKTVMGFTCWFGQIRKKRPYPNNADQTESIASSCTVNNGTATNDTLDFQAGVNSLRVVFTSSEYAKYVRYPTAQNLNKNIDIYTFLSLRVKCSSSSVVITVRLYDKDGNYNYASFSVDKADIWYLKHLDLEEDFSGSIDWDDIPLYYWEIHVDGACTLRVDNFNFNDDWFFTAPSGKLVIAHRDDEEPPSEGFPFYIDYSYNPFLSPVPTNIKKATAKIAGVSLLDYMLGRRDRDTAFLLQSDTLVRNIDKETLGHLRYRLKEEAETALASYGYGFEFVPVQA